MLENTRICPNWGYIVRKENSVDVHREKSPLVGWVLRAPCQECQDTSEENLCRGNVGCWTANYYFGWNWGIASVVLLLTLVQILMTTASLPLRRFLLGEISKRLWLRSLVFQKTHLEHHLTISVAPGACKWTLEALASWVSKVLTFYYYPHEDDSGLLGKDPSANNKESNRWPCNYWFKRGLGEVSNFWDRKSVV